MKFIQVISMHVATYSIIIQIPNAPHRAGFIHTLKNMIIARINYSYKQLRF